MTLIKVYGREARNGWKKKSEKSEGPPAQAARVE